MIWFSSRRPLQNAEKRWQNLRPILRLDLFSQVASHNQVAQMDTNIYFKIAIVSPAGGGEGDQGC